MRELVTAVAGRLVRAGLLSLKLGAFGKCPPVCPQIGVRSAGHGGCGSTSDWARVPGRACARAGVYMKYRFPDGRQVAEPEIPPAPRVRTRWQLELGAAESDVGAFLVWSGDGAGGDRQPAHDLAAAPSSAVVGDGAGSIVLVEGESDRVALRALAIRRGLDLKRAGIEVAVLGGAQAIGAYLRDYRDRGDRRRLSGLYDTGEEALFRRALERHGCADLVGRRDLEARGFFCCDLDLEDELIRALGAPTVISVIAEQGDAQPFRKLQHQPEWRGRQVECQLRRFMGSGARRKIRYAKLLVDALDPDRVPRPLDAVLQAAIAYTTGQTDRS